MIKRSCQKYQNLFCEKCKRVTRNRIRFNSINEADGHWCLVCNNFDSWSAPTTLKEKKEWDKFIEYSVKFQRSIAGL